MIRTSLAATAVAAITSATVIAATAATAATSTPSIAAIPSTTAINSQTSLASLRILLALLATLNSPSATPPKQQIAQDPNPPAVQVAGIRVVGNGGGHGEMLAFYALRQLERVTEICLKWPIDCQLRPHEKALLESLSADETFANARQATIQFVDTERPRGDTLFTPIPKPSQILYFPSRLLHDNANQLRNFSEIGPLVAKAWVVQNRSALALATAKTSETKTLTLDHKARDHKTLDHLLIKLFNSLEIEESSLFIDDHEAQLQIVNTSHSQKNRPVAAALQVVFRQIDNSKSVFDLMPLLSSKLAQSTPLDLGSCPSNQLTLVLVSDVRVVRNPFSVTGNVEWRCQQTSQTRGLTVGELRRARFNLFHANEDPRQWPNGRFDQAVAAGMEIQLSGFQSIEERCEVLLAQELSSRRKSDDEP